MEMRRGMGSASDASVTLQQRERGACYPQDSSFIHRGGKTMSEPSQLASDPVTLDSLKRAVASVRPEPSMYPPDEPQCHDDWRQDWSVHHATRAAAWQTAFDWLRTHHGP